MSAKPIQLFIIVFFLFLTSCSNNEDEELIFDNLKNVTNCELTITSDTLNSICVDGTNLAAAGETIQFASSFYSKLDDATDSEFTWNVVSGSMEILEVETYTEGAIVKSIATIKFLSDFAGNGVLRVEGTNLSGSASMNHLVDLDVE